MINCLNPVLIINPGVYEAVAFSHKVYDGSVFRYFNGVSKLFEAPLFSFLDSLKDSITFDNIDNFYTFDRFNRKVFCFLFVPCRHCILCEQADQNCISQRLQMESELYQDEPYFITLTFAPHSLPKDNYPNIRFIQRYIKRLRNYAIDEFNCKIRYYAQGEHGTLNNRAHYHLIIFGLPTMPYTVARKFFERAWLTDTCYYYYKGKRFRKLIGFVYVSQINDPNYAAYFKRKTGRDLNPSDGLRYCCKYSSKNSACRTWSKGLGSAFAIRFAPSVFSICKNSFLRPDWNLSYTDKYGGTQRIIFSRWFLHICFKVFNRNSYLLRSKIYNYIISLVSTRVDYLDFSDFLKKYSDLVGVNLFDLNVSYVHKTFSNMREIWSSYGHDYYIKRLRCCFSTNFIDMFNDFDFDFFKQQTLLYDNFCKLYFSNKSITVDDVQFKAFKRQKYLNKQKTLLSL